MRCQSSRPLPVEIFNKKYFEPSGLNITQFAKRLGVSRYRFLRVLQGANGMSPYFIEKLSKLTKTKPSFWHYLQSDYLFEKFLSRRTGSKKIKPIVPKIPSEDTTTDTHVGTLYEQFLKSEGKTWTKISIEYKKGKRAFFRIVEGKNRIDPRAAAEIASDTKTEPELWLDMQLRYDISRFLQSNEVDLETKNELQEYSESIISEKTVLCKELNNVHPGVVLLDEFLKPSKIAAVSWGQLFCVSKKMFLPMLNGQKDLPIGLVVKLKQIFETDIKYWLTLQRCFHLQEAGKHKVQFTKCIPGEHNKSKKRIPAEILFEDYILPLNMSIKEFARHIHVDPTRLYSLKHNRMTITFELAARLGEALDMDPNFWVRLQLDNDIKNGRQGKLQW